MKILLVSTSSGSRGGGELWLKYLGIGLKNLGHEVGLWVSSDPNMDELAAQFSSIGEVIRSPYINTYKHRGRSLSTLFNFSTSKSLKTVWENWQPDILHINKQNLEDGLDILRAADGCSFPSVCMIHITQSAQTLKAAMPQLRDWVARFALQNYSGQLVTAPQTRADSLKEFLQRDRSVKVILNAAPSINQNLIPQWRTQKRIELNINDDEILFVSVGRMVAQKNPMYFLKVASEIKHKLPSAQFLWIGDGNLSNEWDKYVQENSLDIFIKRLPWQHEVIPWLAASDIYLHLAEFEGMPFSVLEALSVGLPCILSPKLLDDIPPFQAEGIICFDDTYEWINKIKSQDNRNQLSKLATHLFNNSFSLQRLAKEYIEVYQQVLQTKYRLINKKLNHLSNS
ncbi:glycosyltransferase family 4 protein [Anabaena sp. UHCC 0187]|uniref:glycosyltransferase family 4 protein n=1 Tax=Anabaena sp. UHCC 0187 TaxID=2590018 RepID=UPI001446D7EA|nr:glycosyltransferase family 4 protein [Anabaena sp. UHCC 0187]MTJ11425.1 glycosyltransferase family 4 protein [Anabaena sp. UHCC 0187]